ncbi:Flp family type IVb pilin [Lentzea aerocolonigenes]|uniref:Flp family type IVb pilin n=1 Tax=Lentzea aerocolonigenes TaxID=68170 RepID=UPI000ACE1B03|nr:Flp family type IVb pilin [Lentzea aerocolonigenes]MCP2250981.1 pilus assembly protein Flp/PilA [Lentzea aerocolonigenes]
MTTRRRDRDRGATAVEYGLMVALIVVAAMVAITAVGDNMAAMFEFIADVIDG